MSRHKNRASPSAQPLPGNRAHLSYGYYEERYAGAEVEILGRPDAEGMVRVRVVADLYVSAEQLRDVRPAPQPARPRGGTHA